MVCNLTARAGNFSRQNSQHLRSWRPHSIGCRDFRSWTIFCLTRFLSLFLSALFSSGLLSRISQMPIVLIPVHFDRDPIDHIPSCQRSVVIRTFITNDFMTGVPATPGKHIPLEVGKIMLSSRALTTSHHSSTFKKKGLLL